MYAAQTATILLGILCAVTDYMSVNVWRLSVCFLLFTFHLGEVCVISNVFGGGGKNKLDLFDSLEFF